MKSTCPSRIRWYSSAIGSLTLSTSSAVVPHLVGGGEDLRAGGGELVVGDAGADAGAGLDEDLVTVADELVDARRGDRHPVLVVLDLAGDSDLHDADTFLGAVRPRLATRARGIVSRRGPPVRCRRQSMAPRERRTGDTMTAGGRVSLTDVSGRIRSL